MNEKVEQIKNYLLKVSEMNCLSEDIQNVVESCTSEQVEEAVNEFAKERSGNTNMDSLDVIEEYELAQYASNHIDATMSEIASKVF